MELTLPPPLDCTPLDDWNPLLLFELLLFEEPLFEEPLPDELLDPSEELPDPVDPLEPEVEPVDELELDEDLLPVLVVAAWVEPGSTTATMPASATLARDTVVVVAFSRRRPSSRSATARATWRAASR